MKNCKTCKYADNYKVVNQDTNKVANVFACVKNPLRPQLIKKPIQNCAQYLQKKEE